MITYKLIHRATYDDHDTHAIFNSLDAGLVALQIADFGAAYLVVKMPLELECTEHVNNHGTLAVIEYDKKGIRSTKIMRDINRLDVDLIQENQALYNKLVQVNERLEDMLDVEIAYVKMSGTRRYPPAQKFWNTYSIVAAYLLIGLLMPLLDSRIPLDASFINGFTVTVFTCFITMASIGLLKYQRSQVRIYGIKDTFHPSINGTDTPEVRSNDFRSDKEFLV